MSVKKIGAKIVIDGEQEFRQALLQSKNAMKEFDSEMKLVTAQFKDNEKSMESLKAKQEVYQKQQQELTKQSKILVEQIQKANEAYKKAEDAQTKQADKIKQLEQALSKAKDEYGDSADEVRELEKELSEANQEYEKQERQIAQLSNKITKWNTDLNKTETELVECDRALKETNTAIDNYGEEVEDAGNETKKFGIIMSESAEGTEKLRVSLGSLVSAQVVVDVLRNCANAIKEVASAAIDVGMKFEASMSNVEALSGATGDELEALGNKAKEMGAKTIYSASESADAFSYMALAGWDAKQMLEGIEPVLNLAAAANMDLAEASDIVTDYITAFGLKAEDAAHFSDAMATAMSTSNTTVEQLAEAYKHCAATCGSMGIEMEDATAVLSTMANAGVKGGEAGTALNTILTRLATNTGECADKLEGYGISVYDAEGNMNSLSYILNGLAEVWGGLTDQEEASLAKSIAGTRQYSRLQTIMLGVSEAAKEGGQSFDDYAAALRDCDGAAEQMAKTMQDNLQGDITILKSALEGLGIATEGVFDDAFRDAVQGATDAVSSLERSVTRGDLGVSLSKLGDSVAELTRNLVESAEDALPGFIDRLTWLIDHVDYITGAFKALVGTYIAFKAASVAAKIATEGLTIALEANPYTLVATALAGLVLATKEYVDAQEKALNAETEFTKETNHFTEEAYRSIDAIDDSIQKRKDDSAAMDAQLEASKKLTDELYEETTSQERRAQIVAQLREMYPELNLSLSEQGEIVGQTKEQLDSYIESSIKMAKVDAAREHLTEIAKDQFEAEMKLAEAKEKVAESSKELYKQQNLQAQEQTRLSHMFEEGTDFINEYDSAVKQAKDSHDQLLEVQTEAQKRVSELGDEYDRTLQYIEDNETIDEAAASMNGLGESVEEVSWITEDLQDAFGKLEEKISSSVQSSLNLTEAWSQDWDTSTDEMTKNVESQIKGVQDWADNFNTLANSSKVAIDENVMKYLAEMGTDGAGLVQQLTEQLETAPEKLQQFSDTMAEYLSIQDEVATTITDSYITVMEDGITGAADAIRENANLVTEAASETLVEGLTEAGEEGSKAIATGLEENTENVATAANSVGDAAVKGIEDKVGANGEKIGEIGEKSDKALGEGLQSGKAAEAAETVSQEVYNAFALTLSAEAGSQIGTDFMGALSDSIETLGSRVLEIARSIAEEAKSIIEAPIDNPGGGGAPPPGHADGLPYVPYDNYIARLHEGERVLTKEENKEYSALLGAVKMPSFDAVQSRLSDMAEGRAVVINNDIRVDGAQDPEAWTQTFIRTLKREARMA